MSAKRAAAAAVALIFFCGFLALGTWQVHRRAWKLDLIARVEARVHAPAVAAPAPPEWPAVTAKTDEYRRVEATGTLLERASTAVQALTDLGSGYWLMTPLRTADGSIVYINRGFVAAADGGGPTRDGHGTATAGQGTATAAEGIATAAQGTAAQGIATAAQGNATQPVRITGLLRLSEPGGGFLRHNDPAANRWYSRDVAAMASARGLHAVAPYFIDADRSSSPGNGIDSPRGGMTVLVFANNHLLYAITWYTLALMIPVSIGLARRAER